MSENKRYYWLKLNENFFEDDTMAWLEEQENGKDYIIFYLKLCLKSLNNDGYLVRYVGERLIPYDVKALAKLTGTSADTVAVAMKTFLEIGLISQLDSGEIYMNQINEMIGSETDSAKRMRKKRVIDSQKQNILPSPSQSDSDVRKSDTEIEIEIEIEKDNKRPSGKAEPVPFAEILGHLNEKTGKTYKNVESNKKYIRARWNEGYTLEDFIKVIDYFASQWKGVTFGNGKQGDDYLRPSTLFNGKFDERLNEVQGHKEKPKTKDPDALRGDDEEFAEYRRIQQLAARERDERNSQPPV